MQLLTKANLNSSPDPDITHIRNNTYYLRHALVYLIGEIIITRITPKQMNLTYLRPIFKWSANKM